MVLNVRAGMPRPGIRKLYFLLKAAFSAKGIKIRCDGLFFLLRRKHMLIKRRKNHTRTTNSKCWLKRHPNLLNSAQLEYSKQVFAGDIPSVKTREQTCSLSLVTDAFGRKRMGRLRAADLSARAVS